MIRPNSGESSEWIGDRDRDDVSPQTRRRLLRNAFLGGSALVGLAGCTDDDESTPTPLNPDSEETETEGGGT